MLSGASLTTRASFNEGVRCFHGEGLMGICEGNSTFSCHMSPRIELVSEVPAFALPSLCPQALGIGCVGQVHLGHLPHALRSPLKCWWVLRKECHGGGGRLSSQLVGYLDYC